MKSIEENCTGALRHLHTFLKRSSVPAMTATLSRGGRGESLFCLRIRPLTIPSRTFSKMLKERVKAMGGRTISVYFTSIHFPWICSGHLVVDTLLVYQVAIHLRLRFNPVLLVMK